jgi:hypothetical protein
VVRIGIREEEVELTRPQLRGDLGALLVDLLLQLGVVRRKIVQLDQVTGAALELVPCADQLPVLGRLARLRARARGVVPRAGLG